MAALLNVKQFVRFDEHGNLHVPNKLFVACQAYVQTPLINDTSSRVATTEWVRAQISSLTGLSVSETDPIWVFEKALYYTKLQADARYLQSFTETDPTVPAWAKTSVKPTYTFAELLSKPTTIAGYGITDIPTTLPASDVYAWAKAAIKPSYAYSEITGLPAIPTNNNQLTNGAGYLTSYTETDPIWTAEKTNYALKTYVDTSISNLVASAPAALNTLNELALALGSDANFSTTVTTLIGTKEPSITAGTTLQYWRGDKSWQTLPIYTLSGLGGEPTIAAGTTAQYWRGDKSWQTLPSYDLSLYVPYVGATSNLNLGYASILPSSVFVTGGSATQSGILAIKHNASGSSTGTYGYTSLYISGTRTLGMSFSETGDTRLVKFFAGSLSANADITYTLPNASGTLALTSNLSAYLPLAGGTLTGPLDGTTATLSSDLTVNGEIISNNYLRLAAGFAIANNIGVNSRAGHSNISVLLSTGQHSLMFWTNTDWSSKLVFTPSANRTFTFPNASGTIALTSDIVSTYVLPIATTTALGGVKVDGTTILINATTGIISGASTYTLPIASTTVLGGIKVGTNLSINATTGVLSSTDTTYAVFTGSTTLVDGAAGLVPKPVVANRLQYLRGDGTWATPPDTDTDTNTVTSIRREDSDGTTGATTYRTGDIRLRQGANVTISEVSAGIFQIASSYVDTDTNTWNANTKTVAGYVAAPGDVANKVWKTDASGNPGWRDDADTDTNTTYSAGTGLTLTGTSFSITKTISDIQTADTIALRNASGQLVATGFYQASSRELKTNISPFVRSALDIIRDVAVVSFNYKTDIINKHIGFIAEDTPEELSTRNKNVMDSNNTIGVLLKAVQELEARIKQLESK